MPVNKRSRMDKNQSSRAEGVAFTEMNYPSIDSILSRLNAGMKNNDVVLPKILKQLMEQKKVSLRGLSRELGIPQSTLSNYLSGKRKTYEPHILSKLARHFGCSIEFLLFGEMKIDTVEGVKSRPLFSKIVRLTIEDVFFDESILKEEK